MAKVSTIEVAGWLATALRYLGLAAQISAIVPLPQTQAAGVAGGLAVKAADAISADLARKKDAHEAEANPTS